LFRYRPVDGAVLAITFLVTLFESVEMGLLAGLVVSVMVFVGRSSKPHIAELGRMAGTDASRNRLRYEVEIDPHVVVIRVDGPLFYASAQNIHDTIIDIVNNRVEVRGLVLDASAMIDVDADGMHALHDLVEELAVLRVGLAIATVRGPVRDLIQRSPYAEELTPRLAPDIPTARTLVSGDEREEVVFL
jgi:SulP family sulfate permease